VLVEAGGNWVIPMRGGFKGEGHLEQRVVRWKENTQGKTKKEYPTGESRKGSGKDRTVGRGSDSTRVKKKERGFVREKREHWGD